jgi:hypothetical protein
MIIFLPSRGVSRKDTAFFSMLYKRWQRVCRILHVVKVANHLKVLCSKDMVLKWREKVAYRLSGEYKEAEP